MAALVDQASPDVATAEGLERVLDVVRSAAREAAAVAFGGFRKHPTIEHKGAVDLVTSFDRESELLLRRRLGEAFPSFAIVGEELSEEDPRAPGRALSDGIAFYVDPIDGTTNFVHGHPFWCVSVGLLSEGLPVLGVVIAPALGVEYFGWALATSSGDNRGGGRGGGRRRRSIRRTALSSTASAILLTQESQESQQPREPEEQACIVSSTSALNDAFLATGFPYDRRTSEDNNFDAFVWMKKRAQGVRRCGSAALDLCLVAEGTYDGYWEMKLRPWDTAAGIAMVRAAGGRVTDYDGGSRFMDLGQVIATNGAVHDPLMTELRKQRDAASRAPAS